MYATWRDEALAISYATDCVLMTATDRRARGARWVRERRASSSPASTANYLRATGELSTSRWSASTQLQGHAFGGSSATTASPIHHPEPEQTRAGLALLFQLLT